MPYSVITAQECCSTEMVNIGVIYGKSCGILCGDFLFQY